MPFKKILKILGFIFVPLLPMAIAVYFLFPYLNEEKHQKVAEENSDEFVIGDTTDIDASAFMPIAQQEEPVEDIGKDYAKMEGKVTELKTKVNDLNATLDSVLAANDSLSTKLAKGDSTEEEAPAEISDAEFSENVKSLLDLDVESLSPILNKMSDKQLVRIFKAGSGLQRKKLLRSLESDRAAKLMTEVL